MIHRSFIHSQAIEPPGRQNDLKEQAPNEGESAKAEADKLFSPVQSNHCHEAASKLDHADLDTEGEDSDQQEHPVVKESCENVVVGIAQLSWVHLVEALHENESLEHNSVELSLLAQSIVNAIGDCRVGIAELLGVDKRSVLGINESEPFVTAEENQEHDKNLIESLSENVSPHDGADNHGVTFVRRAIKQSLIWRLSSKS